MLRTNYHNRDKQQPFKTTPSQSDIDQIVFILKLPTNKKNKIKMKHKNHE